MSGDPGWPIRDDTTMRDAISPLFRTAKKTACAVFLLAVVGCGAGEPHFPVNRVYLRQQELAAQIDLSGQQRQDIVDTLEFLFGTPDEPCVPRLANMDVGPVLQLDTLRSAAGPVSSDQDGNQFGLYRKHCAHCHGLSGDGAGPSAVFLEPYPRDFRRGIFKYKSTPGPLAPPTHEDLARAIRNGSPGSAMPAFNLLTDAELESLVQYVKYLSIRGEVERALIFDSIDLLDDEYDRLVDPALRDKDPDEFAEQMAPITAQVRGVVQRWLDAPGQVTPVPPPPENWNSADAIRRGQELFGGKVANCAKCHGSTGRGDGENVDYDDWAREIVDPQNPDAVKPYLALGALYPTPARPRNLEYGIYRGGSRPEDLYRRILNGISGTPMPAIPLRPDDAKPDDQRLTADDVWYLVAYVLSLRDGGLVQSDQ
jgi:mono/diheme cytochrome c family protein